MANYQNLKVCTKKIFFHNKVQNSFDNQLHQLCFSRVFHFVKGLHKQRCADFLPQQKLMCSLLKGPTRPLRCSRTQGKQQHQKSLSQIYRTYDAGCFATYIWPPPPLSNLFFGANSVYLQNDKINAQKVLLNIFYTLKKSPMQHLGTFKSTAHL